MVTTQAEKVLKAQNDLLDELNNKNDFAVRVATRTGRVPRVRNIRKTHSREKRVQSTQPSS